LAEAGETEATAHKHLEYYVTLAETGEAHAYGREQAVWYDRQEAEMDNLRAALAWSLTNEEIELGLRMAAALRWVWDMRGYHVEGAEWYKKLLAVSQNVSPLIRAKTLHRACEILSFVGEAVQARLWGEEACKLSHALNDRWNIAWSLCALGWSSYYDQHPDESASMLDESIALFRELDDPFGLSHALRRRSFVASFQGDFAYGQTLTEEALIRDRAAGDKNATAWELCLMGELLWRRHHHPAQVVVLYQESITLFREIHDVHVPVYPLVALADVERFQGNYARADALYQEALLFAREQGTYWTGTIGAVAGMGGLAAVLGRSERGVRLLGAAHNFHAKGVYESSQIAKDNLAEDIAVVRAQLDDLNFDQLWLEGQTMTLEQAIAYALQDETPPAETMANQPLIDPLSERELEILRLLAAGLNSREIAQSLVLSVNTIRSYRKHIYGKLDAHTRAQAIARAKEMKLLE
jgi:DNA-binding CsgD family transcriptional regulator